MTHVLRLTVPIDEAHNRPGNGRSLQTNPPQALKHRDADHRLRVVEAPEDRVHSRWKRGPNRRIGAPRAQVRIRPRASTQFIRFH